MKKILFLVLDIFLILGIFLILDIVPLAQSQIMIESEHPYSNNYENTWPPIVDQGAVEVRLHFNNLDLNYGDKVTLLDKDENEIARFGGYRKESDFWTEWYTTDTIKVRFFTDGKDTSWGFKIDKIENRTYIAPASDLPESYHPYANNYEYTWPEIASKGLIRLHFSKLDIDYYDKLIITDKDGKELMHYIGAKKIDFWSDWLRSDAIKVRLETNDKTTSWGFKIDQIETVDALDTPVSTPIGKNTEIGDIRKNIIDSGVKIGDIPKRTTASVNLHGEKTDVKLGEDILLRLSAVNLIDKPPMTVQVIIIPPSGMSVSSSEFVKSGAGQFTTSYNIGPGQGRDIEVKIMANQIGDFVVNGRIVYFFESAKNRSEDYTLQLPIKVRDIESNTDEQSRPRYGTFIFFVVVVIIVLRFVYVRRRYK